MDIKIECQGAGILPVGAMKDFQGELKSITDENLQKLKNSIIKNGFSAPIFIWENGKNKYILDGHQRLKAVIDLQSEGYHVPELPVVYIQAKNKKQAKEKLLYISSQYGEFEREGYIGFVADLDVDGIRLTSGAFYVGDVDDIDVDSFFDTEHEEKEKVPVVCPHCGMEL